MGAKGVSSEFQSSLRDCVNALLRYPEINFWAIFGHPYGMWTLLHPQREWIIFTAVYVKSPKVFAYGKYLVIP